MESLKYFYGVLDFDKKLPMIKYHTFEKGSKASGKYVFEGDTILIVPTLKDRWKVHAIAHELMHSTGAKERLNRNIIVDKTVTMQQLCVEEILAEAGAAILCKKIGNFDELSRLQFSVYCKHYVDRHKKMGGTIKDFSFLNLYQATTFYSKVSIIKEFFEVKKMLVELYNQ